MRRQTRSTDTGNSGYAPKALPAFMTEAERIRLTDKELFAYYKAHDVWFSLARLLRPDGQLSDHVRRLCYDLAEAVTKAKRETAAHRKALDKIRSAWRADNWPGLNWAPTVPAAAVADLPASDPIEVDTDDVDVDFRVCPPADPGDIDSFPADLRDSGDVNSLEAMAS